MEQVQYISDENKNVTGVIVPIDLWKEIQSEKETAYLFKSETMKHIPSKTQAGSDHLFS